MNDGVNPFYDVARQHLFGDTKPRVKPGLLSSAPAVGSSDALINSQKVKRLQTSCLLQLLPSWTPSRGQTGETLLLPPRCCLSSDFHAQTERERWNWDCCSVSTLDGIFSPPQCTCCHGKFVRSAMPWFPRHLLAASSNGSKVAVLQRRRHIQGIWIKRPTTKYLFRLWEWGKIHFQQAATLKLS